MEKQIMEPVEKERKTSENESIVEVLRRLRKDPEAMRQAKIVSNL